MKLIANFSLLIFLISFNGIAQPLKVTTFNIRLDIESDQENKWANRKASVIDFIMFEEPDFIGMQEVLLGQLNDLEDGLINYSYVGVARDDGKEEGEFTPLFFNNNKWELLSSETFWLSETPKIPSKSWDAAYTRICTWGRFISRENNQEVIVLNTHLDNSGEKARRMGAQLIIEKIGKVSKDTNTILLGDFNAEPNAESIKYITDKTMKDAFEIADRKFGEIGTFNGFDLSDITSRRIDYVFVSEGFEVEKYGVDSDIIDGRYLSDHFPVTVYLNAKSKSNGFK